MDPTATWDQMLDAFGDEDWETTRELADAMLAWFRQGGFPPIVSVGSSVGDCFMIVQDEQARRSTADTVARAIAAHAKQCLK
ncbi:MAG: hypothetical protein AAFN77_18170 [Planctomycetota bacterium]